MERWEYCVAAQVPSGPLIVNVTYYHPEGAAVKTYRAKDYDEGVKLLWPRVIAELGRERWELVTVDSGAWHFKRLMNDFVTRG